MTMSALIDACHSESDHHNEVRASVSTTVCLGLSHDSLGISPVPRKNDINSHLSPSNFFPACIPAEYMHYF